MELKTKVILGAIVGICVLFGAMYLMKGNFDLSIVRSPSSPAGFMEIYNASDSGNQLTLDILNETESSNIFVNLDEKDSTYISLGDYDEFSPWEVGNKTTFSIWVKVADNIGGAGSEGRKYILAKGNTANFEYALARTKDTAGQTFIFNIYPLSGSTVTQAVIGTYELDTWYHLVVVYDPINNRVRTYMNGDYSTDIPTTVINGSGTASLNVGFRADAPLNGSVDDLRIFSGDLGGMAVADMYKNHARGDNLTRIPVLMLHQYVGNAATTNSLQTNESQFRELNQFLVDERYQTMTLQDYYNCRELGNCSRMPDKPIIFTWDDASIDQWHEAAIVQAEYSTDWNFSSVMSLSTLNVGSGDTNNWTTANDTIHTYGWDIASHSDRHCHHGSGTGGTSPVWCNTTEERRGNMSASYDKIVANTGVIPRAMIFPWNDYGVGAAEIQAVADDCTDFFTYCFGSAYQVENPEFITITSNETHNGFKRIEFAGYTSATTVAELSLALNYTRNLETETHRYRMDEGTGNLIKDDFGTINGTVMSPNEYVWNDQSLYNNLKMYYSFDKTSDLGKILDLSRNKMQGTPTGSPTYGAGKIGSGLQFDGVDDIVTGSTYGFTELTVSMWMKPNFDNYTDIIRQYETSTDNRVWSGFVDLNKNLKFQVQNASNGGTGVESSVFTTTPLTIGNWYHVVFTAKPNGKLRLYLNNVEVSNSSFGNTIIKNSTSSIKLGANMLSTNRFNGTMDEVMIFDRALTPEQISAIYNNQSERFSSSSEAVMLGARLLDSGYSSINLSISSYERTKGTNISIGLAQWDPTKGYNSTPMEGMIAWYRFDGNAEDSSGLDHDLTMVGDGDYRWDSMYGQTINLDGVGSADYGSVTTDDYFNFSSENDVSIAFWVKPEDVEGTHARQALFGLLTPDTLWSYFDTNADEYRCFAQGSTTSRSVVSTTEFDDNKWYHVVCMVTDGIVKIYVNGNLEATDTVNIGTIYSGSTSFGVGAYSSGGNNFDGSVDDFMIFNRTLSNEEVKDLYVRGRANWTSPTSYANLTASDANDNVSRDTYSINEKTTNILAYLKLTGESTNFYTPMVMFNTLTLDLVDSVAPILSSFTNNANKNVTYENVTLTVTTSGEGGKSAFIKDDSLRVWLRFENNSAYGENATYVYDRSGNGYHGAISQPDNATITANGIRGKALATGGSETGSLTINTLTQGFSNSTGYTVSFWMNPLIKASRSRPIGSDYWIAAYFETGADTLAWFVGNGNAYTSGLSSADFITYNEWQLVTIVNNGTHGILYRNGVQYATQNGNGVGNMGSGANAKLALGSSYSLTSNLTTNAFNGSLDEFMIFNRTLSADEIYQLYNASSYSRTISSQSEGDTTYTAYVLDIGGSEDSENLTITYDQTSPTVSLITPENGTQDTDGVIRFIFNPVDDNIANCSLYYQSGKYTTSSSIVSNLSNVIEVVSINNQHVLYTDDLQWYISCTDLANNVGNSSVYRLDTKADTTNTNPPQGGGGGDQTGGTTNTTTSDQDPKYVNLLYPDVWNRGDKVNVRIQAFNQSNSMYAPKDVKFEYSIVGVTLEDSGTSDSGEIFANFRVLNSAETGQKTIKVIVTDDRTVEYQLKFTIDDGIVVTSVTGDKTVIDKYMWYALWGAIGLFGLVFFVILLLALVHDSKGRKQ